MKIVKVILVVFAVVALIVAAFWQVWLKDQVAYARIATAYGAKMACSCRFVAGREMASCRRDFTQDLSMFTFEETQTDAGRGLRVSVFSGLVSGHATHTPGRGCTLVQ
jgi:hypothetical protein